MKTFIITVAVIAVIASLALLLKTEHTYRTNTNLQLEAFIGSFTEDGTKCPDGEPRCPDFEQCFYSGIRSRYTNHQFDALAFDTNEDTACELYLAFYDQVASCSVSLTTSDYYEETGQTADDVRRIAEYAISYFMDHRYCDDSSLMEDHLFLIRNICVCRQQIMNGRNPFYGHSPS